ncbi:TetR/AcrR family transcriptional regulator [Pseudonocardia sp. S2-4]|uniref:TetR/AcrR family transcriptional regulator n=1 Tax=Pseudonocardia humida TaxID=2800819 RepID=A0ABT0ZSH7_9PSEU|nr:TetR/AcrR family transcriptional regulator [Pseudonocardia humida]
MRRVSEARERLLRTASALFYAEGIRAVGVDRVIEEAGITRATFYRHFPSKDDLVVAYLTVVHEAVRDAAGEEVGEQRLRRTVGTMGEMVCSPGFRGCSFINAAAEFADPDSPVHRAVTAHRRWLGALFAADLTAAGHPDPAAAAAHLMMLRDGAMVAGYLADPEVARTTLGRGLDAILAEAR